MIQKYVHGIDYSLMEFHEVFSKENMLKQAANFELLLLTLQVQSPNETVEKLQVQSQNEIVEQLQDLLGNLISKWAYWDLVPAAIGDLLHLSLERDARLCQKFYQPFKNSSYRKSSG